MLAMVKRYAIMLRDLLNKLPLGGRGHGHGHPPGHRPPPPPH